MYKIDDIVHGHTMYEYYLIIERCIYKEGFSWMHDDVISDLYMYVDKSLERYDSEKGVPPTTYVYVMCKWELIRKCRKIKNSKDCYFEDLQYSDVRDRAMDIEDIAVDNVFNQELLNSYRSILTEREYEYIVLALHGYSWADVARMKKVSRQAVNNTVSSMREKISAYNRLKDINSKFRNPVF